MLAKQPIEDLLKELNKLFNNPAAPAHADYYAKIALLELCGWLEAALDDIILTYAKSKLKESKNIDLLEQEIVGKTYGCDYKDHARQMLIKIVGLINVEKLETELTNLGVFQILVSQLGSLWSLRKPEAHTTIAGITRTFQAPTAMLRYLSSLAPILGTFETELNKI